MLSRNRKLGDGYHIRLELTRVLINSTYLRLATYVYSNLQIFVRAFDYFSAQNREVKMRVNQGNECSFSPRFRKIVLGCPKSFFRFIRK